MGSPDIAASEPEVVIGPDGLPRLSQAYLDAYERFMQTLVTEDDRPNGQPLLRQTGAPAH